MSSDFLFIRSPPSLKRPRPPPLPLDHAGGVLASQLQVPDEPPWIVKSLPTPPLKSALSRPGSPRWRSSEDVLRFDESRVEVIPTWSADDYSRMGPVPVTKLTPRDVLELRDLKISLGVLSLPTAAVTPSSTSTSSSEAGSPPLASLDAERR